MNSTNQIINKSMNFMATLVSIGTAYTDKNICFATFHNLSYYVHFKLWVLFVAAMMLWPTNHSLTTDFKPPINVRVLNITHV